MSRPEPDNAETPSTRPPCLVRSVATVMAKEPAVEAVTIDGSAQEISVATLGRSEDPRRVADRITETVRQARAAGEDAWCGLLTGTKGCEACELEADVWNRQGLAIRQEAGRTTIARHTCPTAPRFWRWHRLTLPKVVPRELEIPEDEQHLNEWKWQLFAAGLCGVFGVVAWLLGERSAALALHLAAYVAGGWYATLEAWERLQRGALDVHFLMLAVAVGSASIGKWEEGSILLFLFSLSGGLEHYALGRTQREIRSLFRTAPKVATLLDESGVEREVPVEQLRPGQRLVLRPDSQFPVDAEIVRGKTAADESNLTGEAVPVDKEVGDTVLAGTMNLWGAVEAVVLRPARESALQKVIRMIREAQHLKAPSQRFTDRFSTGYTYAALGLTVAMFLVWWLVAGLPPLVAPEGTQSAFYRAMILLVVASPCALVLSIPSAVLAAIAWGARRGVLFRGGAAVERLAEVDVVALDKTGTLTTGELQVEAVQSFPAGREDAVSRLAFSIERHSAHPLARAVTRHGKHRGLDPLEVHDVESITGMGIRARQAGTPVFLGRREWIEQICADGTSGQPGGGCALLGSVPETEAGQSELWVAAGDLLGRVLLRDAVREQARPVIEALRRLGLETLVLTGDRPAAAAALRSAVGLDDVRAQLKPEQKVQAIHELTRAGRRVAMVGDGVNDAPSLAAAYVGVAMGARGSDAALEQAEIVLMHDRLENFLAAYQLSHRARRVIRQNLVISLGTVAVLVGCALLGTIPLTVGVVGHEGSTVLVVMNSLRLLFGPRTATAG